MDENTTVQNQEDAVTSQRKVGRPSPNRSRAKGTSSRPNRTRVGAPRDAIEVLGKDPAYVYRWVNDYDENGARLARFKDAGYEFVQGANIELPKHLTYHDESNGTIVRKFLGMREGIPLYGYLLRIYREWYEEDQEAKQAEIIAVEDSIDGSRSPETNELGQYGEIRIGSRRRR